MTRLRWFVVLAVLLAMVTPASARACTCLPAPPPSEALERADFVFTGEVTEVRRPENTPPGQGEIVYTFDIGQAIKGAVKSPFEVVSAASGAACGRSFARGQAYLVYARSKDGRARDNLCSRTRRLEDAGEDLEFLRGRAERNDDTNGARADTTALPPEPPRAEPPAEPPPPVTGQCRACGVDVSGHRAGHSTAWLILVGALALRRRDSA
jgi:hypothetical protein